MHMMNFFDVVMTLRVKRGLLTCCVCVFFCVAYYVAFGPHGPRAPVDAPGAGYKITLSVVGLIAVAGAIFMAVRSAGT